MKRLHVLHCALLAFAIAGLIGCSHVDDADHAAGASRVVMRDGAEFRVEVDRVLMASADRLNLRVAAIGMARGHVELPLIGDTLGDFAVIEVSPQRTITESAGRLRRERDIVLEPFLPGEYRIPPLAFAVLPEGGDAAIVETPEIVIHVSSALGEQPPEAGLAPWFDIVDADSTQWPWMWAIAVAGLGVMAVPIVMWRRRRSRGAPRDGVIARATRTLREATESHNDSHVETAVAIDACVLAFRDAAGAMCAEAGIRNTDAMTLGQLVERICGAKLVDESFRARLMMIAERVEHVRFGNKRGDCALVRQFAGVCLEAIEHMAAARTARMANSTEARAA